MEFSHSKMGIRASQTTISNHFLDFGNGTHDFYVCFAGKHKVITHVVNTSWAVPAKLLVYIGQNTKNCMGKESILQKTPW